jgi:hypothetical protein
LHNLRIDPVNEIRKGEVELQHPERGKVIIRDQKTTHENLLRNVLTDCTPAEWWYLLNQKVFFWPSMERLSRHMSALGNRGRKHLVLVVDSYRLAAAYESAIVFVGSLKWL